MGFLDFLMVVKMEQAKKEAQAKKEQEQKKAAAK